MKIFQERFHFPTRPFKHPGKAAGRKRCSRSGGRASTTCQPTVHGRLTNLALLFQGKMNGGNIPPALMPGGATG
ncbi:MAG: hypothetical protein LBF09_04555 [Odoribacteraceae bacterium]|nr:hypothetical protein [Odoribacteraceae bacterium]